MRKFGHVRFAGKSCLAADTATTRGVSTPRRQRRPPRRIHSMTRACATVAQTPPGDSRIAPSGREEAARECFTLTQRLSFLARKRMIGRADEGPLVCGPRSAPTDDASVLLGSPGRVSGPQLPSVRTNATGRASAILPANRPRPNFTIPRATERSDPPSEPSEGERRQRDQNDRGDDHPEQRRSRRRCRLEVHVHPGHACEQGSGKQQDRGEGEDLHDLVRPVLRPDDQHVERAGDPVLRVARRGRARRRLSTSSSANRSADPSDEIGSNSEWLSAANSSR